MYNQDDVVLVGRAKNGSEQALVALYQRYLPQIYGYIINQVGHQTAAEDITSEVFLKMVKCLQDFQGKSSFKNWLYAITKKTIADYWRQHYKCQTVDIESFAEIKFSQQPGQAEKFETEMENKEAAVEKILEALPGNYRQILEFRFLKNYSLQETADALKKSLANVKVLQYRALKKACELSQNI